MKIIIAGSGEVGTHLAKLLSQEHQDITVIDKDAAKLAALDASCNLLTYVANPISVAAQKSIDVGSSDLFIAVTPFETENIMACQIADSLGARKTVARIDSYEFKDPANAAILNSRGVDATIYPEQLAAEKIHTALRHTWVRDWFELNDGELIVIGVRLRRNAPITGMQLKDFAMREHNFHVDAIRRRGEIIIPRGDDRLLPADILYVTTTREHADDLRHLCGKTQIDITNVIISGATRIAMRLIKTVPPDRRHRYKVIDPDRARCEKLLAACPDVEVANADPRDIEVLRDEGVSDADAFIALSDSSESNILTCLTAREMGAGKAIAEVENIQFIPIAESLGISTIVNKKLLASGRIFQSLLDADDSTPRCLALADAEVAEIEAKPGSKITRGPVRTLNLPRDFTIGGLLREGKGRLVGGNDTIMAGDRVVIFCLQGSLHKTEKWFS